ncbi:hypothetical protein [Novosphingobium resinovorum]|uniref:Uncharacterized protein n=1 Tax=Novosphingobium resinovorum TaxID=158500 RepID=A0A1D8A382_9SPHN|nr:hypothetical protein [Novosphingobium resinovorum]AOR76575.1 hypothetical protein BES08_07295 [Novosphingobium resinovorum]
MGTSRSNTGARKAVEKVSPSQLERPEIEAEDDIDPVFALFKVTYGDGRTAPSKSIFTPFSETERNELLDLKAVRELTADEAKLFTPTAAASTAPAGSDVIE